MMPSTASTRSHLPLAGWAGLGAGVLSIAGLLVRGRAETGSAAAPVNAVSHWWHGRQAFEEDRPTVRHTVLGAVVHLASAFFWAALYDAGMRRVRPEPTDAELAAGAAGVTALAALTDFKLVPERLTPGFEHRLSRGSLVTTYALFGAGLLLGAMMARRR